MWSIFKQYFGKLPNPMNYKPWCPNHIVKNTIRMETKTITLLAGNTTAFFLWIWAIIWSHSLSPDLSSQPCNFASSSSSTLKLLTVQNHLSITYESKSLPVRVHWTWCFNHMQERIPVLTWKLRCDFEEYTFLQLD